MKQVTGNNITSAKDKVSIQLKLGGHSFSEQELNGIVTDGPARVIVSTPKVTLVPCSVAADLEPARALELCGLALNEDETAVYSSSSEGRMAAIAVSRKALDILSLRFSDLEFHSLLEDVAEIKENGARIIVENSVCYIAIFRQSLLRAEAIEAKTPEDILYFFAEEWDICSMSPDDRIVVRGEKEYRKIFSRYFKKTECE